MLYGATTSLIFRVEVSTGQDVESVLHLLPGVQGHSVWIVEHFVVHLLLGHQEERDALRALGGARQPCEHAMNNVVGHVAAGKAARTS